MTPQQKAQLRAQIAEIDVIVVDEPPIPQPSGPGFYFAPNGVNTNLGTIDSPKRDIAGINLNTLEAGFSLRFQCGGVYATPSTRLANLNSTALSRLTFESYGVGARPVLQFGSGQTGFEFGRNFNDTVAHGGYAFKNLAIVGTGVDGSWGFWAKRNVSDVLIDNCLVTGWYIALNGQGNDNSTRIVVRNCLLTGNAGMGIMGCFYDSIIEGNDFSDNISLTSHFVHKVYLRGGDRNIVRNNRLLTDAACRGGSLTFHGLVQTSLVIEGNNFRYGPGGDEGAWVISLIPDTGAATGGFRGLVIRNNFIQNAGNNAIHVEAAPGALIENNTVVLTAPRNQMAVGYVDDPSRPQDLKGGGIVRGNRARGVAGSSMTFTAPAGSTMQDNLSLIE